MKEAANQPYFVVIAGPSGSGKSTTGRILARKTCFVLLDIDNDRFYSGLPETGKANSEEIMRQAYRITNQRIRTILSQGMPVISVAVRRTPDAHEVVRKIAQDCNAHLFVVELLAPSRVLKQRVAERPPDHLSGITSSDALDRQLGHFHLFSDPKPLKVDTSKLSPEAVAEEILSQLESERTRFLRKS